MGESLHVASASNRSGKKKSSQVGSQRKRSRPTPVVDSSANKTIVSVQFPGGQQLDYECLLANREFYVDFEADGLIIRQGRLADKGFLGKAACNFHRNILETIGMAKMLDEFEGTVAALEEEKAKAVSSMEREKKRADDALTALKTKANLAERYRKEREDAKTMVSNFKLEVEDLAKKLEEAKLANNELKSTVDRLGDEKKAVDTQFQAAVKMLTAAGSEFMGRREVCFTCCSLVLIQTWWN